MKYRKANIYISALPPRNDNIFKKSKEVNNFLNHNMPENLKIIHHNNLSESNLSDKKHLKKESMGKFVKNMKDVMKRALGKVEGDRNRFDQLRREEHQQRDVTRTHYRHGRNSSGIHGGRIYKHERDDDARNLHSNNGDKHNSLVGVLKAFVASIQPLL